MVDAVGETLADHLLESGDWAEALSLLSEQADAPPEKLARCHEGRKAWREAAQARLAANQPAEALENYRRAGAIPEAAALARELGQDQLAEMLGLLAGLSETLDRLAAADLDAIAEGEANSLARRLRDAADLVTRRRRKR